MKWVYIVCKSNMLIVHSFFRESFLYVLVYLTLNVPTLKSKWPCLLFYFYLIIWYYNPKLESVPLKYKGSPQPPTPINRKWQKNSKCLNISETYAIKNSNFSMGIISKSFFCTKLPRTYTESGKNLCWKQVKRYITIT